MNTSVISKIKDVFEAITLKLKTANRYLTSAVFALAIAVLECWLFGIGKCESIQEMVPIISDAFGISGGLLIGWGMIALMTFYGFFDVIGYGIQLLTAALERKTGNAEQADTINYRNYSMEDYKREKDVRRIYTPYQGLVIGTICFVLSIALNIVK